MYSIESCKHWLKLRKTRDCCRIEFLQHFPVFKTVIQYVRMCFFILTVNSCTFHHRKSINTFENTLFFCTPVPLVPAQTLFLVTSKSCWLHTNTVSLWRVVCIPYLQEVPGYSKAREKKDMLMITLIRISKCKCM